MLNKKIQFQKSYRNKIDLKKINFKKKLKGKRISKLEDFKVFPVNSCNGFIAIQKIICSKDGKQLFTFTRNLILIYSLKTGFLMKKIKEHTNRITGICLSVNHPFRLYSCSLDKTICEWDLLRGICVNKIFLKMKLWKIISGKNRLMLHGTIKQKSKIIFLDFKSWKKKILNKIKKIEDLNANCNGDFFSIIEGKKCYILDDKGIIKIVKCPYQITISSFNPTNPNTFALGCKGGEICLFNDLRKQKNKTIYHWHSRAVKALAFTKDGGYLISGGEESVLVLWQRKCSLNKASLILFKSSNLIFVQD